MESLIRVLFKIDYSVFVVGLFVPALVFISLFV